VQLRLFLSGGRSAGGGFNCPGGVDKRESRDTQEGQGWDCDPNSWTWL